MYSKFSFIKYQGNQKSYSKKHVMGKTTEKKVFNETERYQTKKLLHNKRNHEQNKKVTN